MDNLRGYIMTGPMKTTEQRANEVANKIEDWASHNRGAPAEKIRQILRDLIYEAFMREKQLTANSIHYRPKLKPAPKIFPPFPFEGHRSLAEVMDTAYVA